MRLVKVPELSNLAVFLFAGDGDGQPVASFDSGTWPCEMVACGQISRVVVTGTGSADSCATARDMVG